MKKRSIRVKKDIEYSVVIEDENFTEERKDDTVKWGVPYKVLDSNSEQVGFGHYTISCYKKHAHLPTEDIIKALLYFCSTSIASDINEGIDIESKSYNMRVDDCRSEDA